MSDQLSRRRSSEIRCAAAGWLGGFAVALSMAWWWGSATEALVMLAGGAFLTVVVFLAITDPGRNTSEDVHDDT